MILQAHSVGERDIARNTIEEVQIKDCINLRYATKLLHSCLTIYNDSRFVTEVVW